MNKISATVADSGATCKKAPKVRIVQVDESGFTKKEKGFLQSEMPTLSGEELRKIVLVGPGPED